MMKKVIIFFITTFLLTSSCFAVDMVFVIWPDSQAAGGIALKSYAKEKSQYDKGKLDTFRDDFAFEKYHGPVEGTRISNQYQYQDQYVFSLYLRNTTYRTETDFFDTENGRSQFGRGINQNILNLNKAPAVAILIGNPNDGGSNRIHCIFEIDLEVSASERSEMLAEDLQHCFNARPGDKLNLLF